LDFMGIDILNIIAINPIGKLEKNKL